MDLEVIKFKIRKFVLYTFFFIVAFELNENHENETFLAIFKHYAYKITNLISLKNR